MDIDIKYMELAYKEALKALAIDEVPVGAVLVQDGRVIAKAHNLRETKQLVTAHAETLVIERACKKLKSWRLEGCTLYTTLEPCIMCSGVIINSRIEKVVYGASDDKWMSLEQLVNQDNALNHKPIIISGILKEKCATLITKYFKDKR